MNSIYNFFFFTIALVYLFIVLTDTSLHYTGIHWKSQLNFVLMLIFPNSQLFQHLYKKQENSRKTSISASWTTLKPLTVWITTNWKILKEMGIPDLLTNLYSGQEATLRTRHGTTDSFQIGKGVCQGCTLSPCLFNFYAEYIMRNAGLEEAQAGIKIAGRNINNLRYADDTTLMAESEEELKSLLIKVKEESEKAGLKLNIQKTKIMASGPSTSCQIDGETIEAMRDFIFWGSKITEDGDCSHEIKRHLLLGRKL